MKGDIYMKNILFSAFLFLAMLFTLNCANRFLDTISHQLDSLDCDIKNYIESSDWDKAIEVAEDLDKKWDKYEDTTSIFVNHNDIDIITTEITKLKKYLQCKDTNESFASLATIECQFKKLHKLEKISLENIL